MDALPAEVRTELLMTAAAFDGHRVTTHRFRSGEPPGGLVASVRDRWRGEGRAVVESRAGAWHVVSTRGADGFTTVQARPAGAGSEGMVSRWRAAEDAGDAVPAVPGPGERWLPPAARVLRRIVHGDPGRESTTVVAWVPSAPDRAADGLRAGASRDGFVVDPALGAPASGAAWYRGGTGSGEALGFRRGREEVVATVSSHRDGAAVVLHWGSPR